MQQQKQAPEQHPSTQILEGKTLDSELQRMFTEVKRHYKPMSKNDLIRTIGALLVDNYVMKTKLDQLESESNAKTPST